MNIKKLSKTVAELERNKKEMLACSISFRRTFFPKYKFIAIFEWPKTWVLVISIECSDFL